MPLTDVNGLIRRVTTVSKRRLLSTSTRNISDAQAAFHNSNRNRVILAAAAVTIGGIAGYYFLQRPQIAALIDQTAPANHPRNLSIPPLQAKSVPSQSTSSPTLSETIEQVNTVRGYVTAPPPPLFTSRMELKQLAKLFTAEGTPDHIDDQNIKDNNNYTPMMLRYPKYDYNMLLTPIFTNTHSPEHHQQLEQFVRNTQDIICQHILNIEKGKAFFRQDTTIRSDGGGIARVLSEGEVFQKAGVNISVANVSLPLYKIEEMSEDHIEIQEFLKENKKNNLFPLNTIIQRFTASISLVIHPINPHVPTCHANYRFFEFLLPNGSTIHWFAGGTDLTPNIINNNDTIYFHQTLKNICDQYNNHYYKKFKKWCDEYFVIKHRGETRGVGGIFFDDLHTKNNNNNSTTATTNNNTTNTSDFNHYFNFIRSCATSFSATYFPLVLSHYQESYTLDDYRFQQLRRGRYIEFNLMYDKGTSFGLKQSNARPEAILMSLPLTARYEYKYIPKPGSPEEYTLQVLKQPKEWV